MKNQKNLQQKNTSSIFQKVKIFPHSLNKSKSVSFSETLTSSSKTDFLEKSNADSKNQNFHLESFDEFNQNSFRVEEKNFDFDRKDSLDLVLKETNPSSQILLNGYSKIQELKLVKIGLASSEKIVEWAEKILPNGKIFGEVLNANTLHYRTFKPHKGGLFCERIFGPLKDFECACGIKQKPFEDTGYVQNLLERKQSRKLFCSNCDVEYTWSVLRRYQLGYIQLVSPVSHLWYLKTNPSYLSLLLDIKKRDLEAMVYCMQITTLEYYWRPLHSLQLNMTASNLLKSYKQFLSLNSQSKRIRTQESIDSQRVFLKFNSKKQKNEFIKRKKYVKPSFTTSVFILKDTDPVEKKIQYLENSFKLSSENVQKTRKIYKTKVQSFLKKKRLNHIEKENFLKNYKQFFNDFYRQLYQIVSKTSFVSMSKVQKVILFSGKNALFDEKSSQTLNSLIQRNTELKQNLPLKCQSNFIFFLKLYLKKKHKKQRQKNVKKFLTLEISILKLQQLSIAQKTNPENYWLPFFEKNQKFFEKLESTDKSAEKVIFLKNFFHIVQSIKLEQQWFSFYQSKINYFDFISNIQFIRRNQKFAVIRNQISLAKLFQTNVFLSFICFLEKNSQISFKSSALSDVNFEQICQRFGFLHDKNLCFQLTKIQNLFQNSTSSSLIWLNFIVLKLSLYFFKIFSDQDLFLELKMLRKKQLTKTTLLFKSFAQIESKENWQNQLLLQNVEKLEKTSVAEKIPEKKVNQFCKNSDFFPMNFDFYQKNLMTFSKKLFFSNTKKWPFSLNLFNNIYTVSYSTGWQTEKDWKYFLYYNISAIEISDQLLKAYKYRFLENSFLNFSNSVITPILGAHFIQKLMFQYEGLEMKKMAKQHQNLLPKLNRYIRLLKPFAYQKSEFLQIQKLLKKRDLIIRRLKLLRKMVKKNSKPSSMILTTLPVLPPDLRPILKMQNQIAASDLNRFYQRILYRNERFKKFLKANTSMARYEPGFELKYAQRLLQEAVDNLIHNGKGSVKPETNSRGQALKSLSEILKGKQGRFRQYLLGKRVDYSGRSVIVVGPTLKIHQCGLPYEMALELFLPFLIKRIFQYQLARTVIGAKTILKTQRKVTWNLLEEVMQNHPILLNRAPTLHRLGIQAFQPKLIEGRAILLHPLVCPAFNADFDGDQMAVHLPITVEARTEAWKLMFSRNHLISPTTGEPMLLPSQDMVLGCYYLTTESLQYRKFHYGRPFTSGTCFYFSTMQEVLKAYAQEKIHLQTPIWLKWNGAMEMDHQFSRPLEIRLHKKGFFIEMYPKFQKHKNFENFCELLFVRTTPGRILFNTVIETSIQT